MFRTIRGRMILCYTAVITVAVLTLALYFSRQATAALTDRAYDSLQQLAINNNTNLDALIKGMDSTANRIVSSDLIKNTFYGELDSEAEEIQSKQEIIKLLFTANGSKIDFQINLLALDGRFAQFGQIFDFSILPESPLMTRPWMAGCLEQEGRPFIVPPRPNEWGNRGQQIFSVCRAFSSSFGAPYDAVAEVQVPYHILEETVEKAVRPKSVRVLVYDRNGQQVYPLVSDGVSDTNYWPYISREQTTGTFPVETEGISALAAYHRSSYSRLTMVVLEDADTLLEPVHIFRLRLYLICFVLLLATTIVTLILSSQLTQPLRRIRHSIARLELNDLHQQEAVPRGSAYELDRLEKEYSRMVERLQQSLEETVTARSRETEARMEALQSQMNPHFLYNTMTVLGIKAEENEDFEVVGMCECLTGMLRYVTRGSSPTATLADELEYLEQYLYLMRCRYPGSFTMDIDVPEELMTLSVPRLIVQPLVENSFKHAFQTSPPWTLEVKAAIDDHSWHLSVTDNGIGFPEDTLNQLRQRFEAIKGDFNTDTKEHIGLANIFERLRFHYRDKALFTIENLDSGGCRITIGGTCERNGLL